MTVYFTILMILHDYFSFSQVLAELLLEREHRERFRRLEGLELMVRMLTNNGYSFYPALRVLDYALAGCRLSCERAVDVSFNMFLKFIEIEIQKF